MDILFAPPGEKKGAMLWFLWLAYALATALLISNHVPWQDEAHPWLIAQNVGWLDIYKEAGLHNAPSLWYYILAIPAKLNCPYWMMQLIHWAGACVAAGIFLLQAPFSIVFKTFFIFSFPVAYDYAVIARPYMLTLLLMWGICAWYPMRYRRPIVYIVLLAILANTSFFGFLPALLLAVDFFCSTQDRCWGSKIGLLLVVFLGILLGMWGGVFQKVQHFYMIAAENYFSWNRLLGLFSFIVVPPRLQSVYPEGFSLLAKWLGASLAVGAAVLVLGLLKRWRAYGLILFLCLGWLGAIFICLKYRWASSQHYGFCLVYAVMALWLMKIRYQPVRRRMDGVLGIFCITVFIGSVAAVIMQGNRDGVLPYSGSKKMAEYLMAHSLDDKVLVAQNIAVAGSILPYMRGVSFWDPRRQEFVRYRHLDGKARATQRPNLTLQLIDDHLSRRLPKYLICNDQIVGREARRLRRVYFADGQIEKFWLYRVRLSPKGRVTRGAEIF